MKRVNKRRSERIRLLAIATIIVMVGSVFVGISFEYNASDADAKTPWTIEGKDYPTLEAATDAVSKNNELTVIELNYDTESAGAVVESGQNILIDLNGHTYINSGGVGSAGTESNAFQFLKGSTVEIKNGIVIGKNPDAKILVQNYSNLQ